MDKIPGSFSSISSENRPTFKKFLENDNNSTKQRRILLELNQIQNFLIENGILMKQKHKDFRYSSLPSLNDLYVLNRQRLSLLDGLDKAYDLVYHVGLHNQMVYVLFLALFTVKMQS